ncbi:MAG: type IX secretion system sortase PorU [Chlorobiota bacterium]
MNKTTKIIVFLAISIATVFTSKAKIEVVESNSKGFTVVYTPELQSLNKINIQGKEYVQPLFSEAGNLLHEPGYPQLMGAQKSFAIPSPTDYRIANIEIGPIKNINSTIAPVYVLGEEDFVNISDRAYKNRPLEDWANVEYLGVGRDLHLAKLNMIAAKYNPAKSAIEIPEYIKVTVKFKSNQTNTTGKKQTNLHANLLNSNVANNWRISDELLFNQVGVEKHYKLGTVQGTQELSSGDWFKITIKEDGVYELTADYLKDFGINIPKDKLNTIKIIGNGGRELPTNPELGLLNDMNQQPITVKTNSDGSLKSIIFFGAAPNGFEYVEKQNLFFGKKVIHYINHFSNENHYLLTWGGDNREDFTERENEQGTPDLISDTFTRRVYFEEELVNAFHSGAGKQFFGRTYFSESFEQDLIHLADEGDIMYRLTLGHKGATNFAGSFTAKDNGKTLSESLLLSSTKEELLRKVFEINLPIDEIPNRNKVVLDFEYTNNSHPGAKGVFDYYELHYTSQTKANNGEVYLFTDPELDGLVQYNFTNFNGDVYAYDITDITNPVKLKSDQPNTFTLKTRLTENEPKRFFLSSNMKKPVSIRSVNIANLRDSKFNHDVIVITNKKLQESAKKFKEYRESNSDLDIGIFYVDDIYNEYNAGTMDITAIRDFVAQAMANWDNKPSYLVLWGDGHYDYRGIVSDLENLVPPHQSDDENTVMNFVQSYSTDDYYARVVGNDRVIDLAVGRLPINNEQEAQVVLDKIKHYEQNSEISNWRTRISLVADDGFSGTENAEGNGDGPLFVIDSEEFSYTRVPDFMEQKKIYSVEYPTQYTAAGNRKPTVNADILKTVNEDGVLLLNWYGHGNPQVWSHEAILDRDVTVRQMVNYDRLFFLTAATCDFAKYDNVDSKSGAETMLLNEFGGAIGVFASARVVYASGNHDINRAFYNTMFTRDSTTGKYPTMGEIIYNLKLTFNGTNDEKYLLIGDPTGRILIPEYDIAISSINGTEINDTTEVSVKGLETVSLTGYVKNPLTGEVDTDFNGSVKLKVFDGDVELEIKDVINRVYRFRKNGGTLANANYEVVNGQFEAKFVLPKDISFSENMGKILAYAFTDDDRNAKGSFDKLRIDGLATTSVSDNNGPNINIYLDSRSFQAGDIVRDEPLLIVDLEDESGINSTGVGVGHKIEAWIDDNTQSIDLTGDYEGSFVDYRKGTSSKILLGLEPGMHTVKVRAWDIYNNYSVAETYFNIDSEGRIVLNDVSAAPTPFADATTIRFNHNMEPPLEANLDIFDASGKKIKSINSTLLNPFEGEIQWDGTDDGGNVVSIGTYYFRIIIDNLNEKNTFLKGRTVKIK